MTGRGPASHDHVRDARSLRARLAPQVLSLLLFVLAVLAPSLAVADILVFTTGRTMSVASSRLENDRLVVTLREGGEASFPSALIARVDQDEVPYPQPAIETAALAPDVASAVPDTLGPVPGARPFSALIATSAATHGVDVEARPRGDRGRVELPAPRAVGQGRQGPDAADAGDRPAVCGA